MCRTHRRKIATLLKQMFKQTRQVAEERSGNFRNFPVVQVLLTGLGSSGMLLDGNQHSDF